MKELSIEEKAKRYDEALEQAKRWHKAFVMGQNYPATDIKVSYEWMFPELKESDDERIRKELIKIFEVTRTDGYNVSNEEALAWLEKQGEQKPANKVEPKFKVGDWITNGKCTWKIDSIDEDMYYNNHCGIDCGGDIKSIDEEYHLWTIQDAKDSDVLAAHECLVLFKEIDGLNIKCYCTYHYMNIEKFYIDTLQNKTAFTPATKEQRDLLFSKMKEASYEWDAEKKELKKIEQKP